MSEGSKLFFHGRAIISNGTTLRCDTNSIIEIGDNFYCNNNCYIRSTSRIRFGDNCLLGWNVQISTTSGHVIKRKNKPKTEIDSIDIGKHVWIAKDVTLSKGVEIAEDSVVAQNSVVISKIQEPNSLIAGIPAKIIARDIEWHA